MNVKKLNLFSVLVFLVLGILAATAVSAVPVTIDNVKLDGDSISATSTNSILGVDRGDEFPVKIEVSATAAVSDAQIRVWISGLHNEDIEDETDTFDMKADVTYVKKLSLTLPDRMDQDRYKLRVSVEDRDGDTTTETYELEVDTTRNLITIKDVVFSPANNVVAGRALLSTVRVKNMGEKDEDGVKVTVAIPELGVSASDYIDELEDGESTTSEELYLRIPSCAECDRSYDVDVEVEYDDGDEVVKTTEKINVVCSEVCRIGSPDCVCSANIQTANSAAQPKTVITIGATTQDVKKGEGGATYPVTVTNAGTRSRTYTVGVDVAGDWATTQISPSNVLVLAAGESTTAYVYVSANENAPAGENMFSVTVNAGDETLKQIPLKANVLDNASSSTWSKVKRVLEIGLVVLVALLVIFGLIIGFNRLKGDEEDESDEDMKGKTYY